MSALRASRRSRLAALASVALCSSLLVACGSASHHAAAGRHHPSTTTTRRRSPTSTATRAAATVAPLTGLPASAAVRRQPAVVLKVDNIAAALPQSGIDQADVVYEEMVEGGLTRLAAVFQSTYPTTAGPVRSGRLTDEGIADDLGHPVLAYSGANAVFQAQLDNQPVINVNAFNHGSLFYRVSTKVEPHNLFTNVAAIAALGIAGSPPPQLWKWRAAGAAFTGSGATPVASFSANFPAATATWTWDATTGTWLRTQDGSPDVSATGRRLDATNVIVESIDYVTSLYVSGEGAAAQGTPIPTGEQVGSGPAWYFSGGREVTGTWRRASLTTPTVFTDSAGNPIALAPGRTWVELVPSGSVPAVTP